MSAYHTDLTVNRMTRAGIPSEAIIATLAAEKKAMMDRILELESICPKRIMLPDGRQFIHHCPDHLVHV